MEAPFLLYWDALAALAEQTGDADRSATLFGAAERVRDALGADVWGIGSGEP